MYPLTPSADVLQSGVQMVIYVFTIFSVVLSVLLGARG